MSRIQNFSKVILVEGQAGFRKRRSCITNVFTFKQIIQKHREFNLETHLAFIDYKKGFHHIQRDTLQSVLVNRGYPRHFIKTVQSR